MIHKNLLNFLRYAHRSYNHERGKFGQNTVPTSVSEQAGLIAWSVSHTCLSTDVTRFVA